MSAFEIPRATIEHTKNIIRKLPKTEIHVHIEAIASTKTYHTLNKKYGIENDLKSPESYRKFTKVSNLSEMISSFTYLQTYYRDPEDYRFVIRDIVQYAHHNNIHYLEVFFSPSIPRMNGLDIHAIYTVMGEEILKAHLEDGIIIKCIVDVSRGFGLENSMTNLYSLLDYKEKKESFPFLIGIGLGGVEMGNKASFFKEAFDVANAAGLVKVAHAGEEVGPESIWEALDILGALRIGHATSAIYDEKLMQKLKKEDIPLEICPTSNIITQRYIKKLEDHPIRTFFDKGLNVTLNTDDPFFFNIDLNDEYINLVEKLNFDLDEIVQVMKHGIYSTFMDQTEKEALWASFQKTLAGLD